MTAYHIVIPARYASSRFPGKPLKQINGKTMLEHVYRVAKKSSASSIVIATDDARIVEAAEKFCDQVLMTSDQHQSGTDRLAEVCQMNGWAEDEIVVNLQGDEPLTPPELLHQVAENIHLNKQASIATLSTPLTAVEEINDPNIVKVVADINGYALYFSRASIPFQRDAGENMNTSHYQRHLGIYAYRAGFLNDYSQMPQCELESIEKLEQLRAMYHGYKIHIQEAVKLPGPGIDTPEDLDKIHTLLASLN
ncbi:MAG: 3-deoxy-manno-octulosonate cytidylyltransferase [endosymbiont of Galathealinum brachiosum]|uniref:3-deoxy-manno-octulosonate cytidylyltransferase n=1 Tax=endosymbiont of Galathealinum brachiosum TaxID=2200906 RepID=A0A370DII2_9GAMM|nr:MAG: 3-deoxy-manno-octulosonate cytidylyltransferase [endosymbiont of Galathealinum brachiosum]